MLNTDTIKELLTHFPLFNRLEDAALDQIVDISIYREWGRGSHIFMQDEPIENVYFVYNGRIKIYKADNRGREQIVAILREGEMFPHVGFFRKGGYPAYAQVVDHAQLVVIPINDFEDILRRNPELCIQVFHVLGEKIVDLQDRLEAQIVNNTYEQIIKLIIRLGETNGEVAEDGITVIKSDYTNQQLAKMIGTTRETVNRTLTKLRKEGLLKEREESRLSFVRTEMEGKLYGE
ncbi:Crp/Fnr family transcriptional regulator [Alkalihalophilus marmarensis]|jgi:CRP/FNR family transcriptional regulator|uniref:Crp/Fnr family transcriptional regulator n=1 Tax=Alkalihalophilus marmarensis TaxID=521377 RepID=UPI0020407B35|nr:Crp/Fnr family transcriptional regulator [Alkalihalophilus marmarensis]MCM3489809.1 Crp/Fnr family transcriptional regulator [Alkalihalophilus marmarensis]